MERIFLPTEWSLDPEIKFWVKGYLCLFPSFCNSLATFTNNQVNMLNGLRKTNGVRYLKPNSMTNHNNSYKPWTYKKTELITQQIFLHPIHIKRSEFFFNKKKMKNIYCMREKLDEIYFIILNMFDNNISVNNLQRKFLIDNKDHKIYIG